MSLRERMRLEEIESDSLLGKPKWFVKEDEVVESTQILDEVVCEEIN